MILAVRDASPLRNLHEFMRSVILYPVGECRRRTSAEGKGQRMTLYRTRGVWKEDLLLSEKGFLRHSFHPNDPLPNSPVIEKPTINGANYSAFKKNVIQISHRSIQGKINIFIKYNKIYSYVSTNLLHFSSSLKYQFDR